MPVLPVTIQQSFKNQFVLYVYLSVYHSRNIISSFLELVQTIDSYQYKKKNFFRIYSMHHFPEHKFIVEEIMLRLLEF